MGVQFPVVVHREIQRKARQDLQGQLCLLPGFLRADRLGIEIGAHKQAVVPGLLQVFQGQLVLAELPDGVAPPAQANHHKGDSVLGSGSPVDFPLVAGDINSRQRGVVRVLIRDGSVPVVEELIAVIGAARERVCMYRRGEGFPGGLFFLTEGAPQPGAHGGDPRQEQQRQNHIAPCGTSDACLFTAGFPGPFGGNPAPGRSLFRGRQVERSFRNDRDAAISIPDLTANVKAVRFTRGNPEKGAVWKAQSPN